MTITKEDLIKVQDWALDRSLRANSNREEEIYDKIFVSIRDVVLMEDNVQYESNFYYH